MSRIYSIPFNGSITAANAAVDLAALRPAADKPIRLRGVRIGQLSEVGDTQEEGINLTVRRFTATVTDGSGGTAPTPTPVDDIDAASGFSARVMDTTEATTSGTNELKEYLPWNVRSSPMEYWWPDERFAPTCRLNANRLILRWETTVADTIDNVSGVVWVEEL